MGKLRSENNGAAASHHGLFASLRRAVRVREERKNNVVDTIVTFCRNYDNGRGATVEVHAAELSDFRRWVASSMNYFKSKNLELQARPGLADETVQL